MRKTRYYHEDAKKDPTLNRVKYTLADGTTITEADFLDAQFELNAFFIFNGLEHDIVRHGVLGYRGIPVEVLIAQCLPASQDVLVAAAKKAAASIAPRLYEYDLTDLEFWAVQQGKTDFKSLETARHEQMILNNLAYLAGRKKEWTLLGIKSQAAMAKLVHQCFGPDWVKRMHMTKCLPARLVQQLLARKTRIGSARVRSANQRPKANRSVAAKAGHEKRRRAK